jgi:ABC-type Fe3+-hydroxamate transport system substrate-binding protein
MHSSLSSKSRGRDFLAQSGEEGVGMRFLLFSKIIFAALALAVGISAFAVNETHKSNFQITSPAHLNGMKMPAGDYTAKWEGEGPTVQVSIMRGSKVLITVPAQVVVLSQPAANTQAETQKGSDGNEALTRLQFSGKKFALDLDNESANGQKAESSN